MIMVIIVGMPKKFREEWKKKFLETLKKLYENSRISYGTYRDLKRIIEEDTEESYEKED